MQWCATVTKSAVLALALVTQSLWGEASAPSTPTQLEEVVVRAKALRFRPAVPFDPQFTFDADEIEAIAADSIEEVIEALTPNLDSGRGRQRGRPVVLLNGQRIGSFREIRRFPPEAIERVEVYPEEVALRYGFRADQKVLNLVLRDPLQIVTVNAEAGASTDGGAERSELSLGRMTIEGPTRVNLAAEHRLEEPLAESERKVRLSEPPSPQQPDPRPYRTLLPNRETSALAASYARALGLSRTVALSVDYNHEREGDEVGPFTVAPATDPSTRLGALERRQTLEDLEINARLNGRRGAWTYSWLNRYGETARDRTTERTTFVESDRSHTQRLSSELLLQGVFAELPQGSLQGNGALRWDREARRSLSQNAQQTQELHLKRARLQGAFSLDYPLWDGASYGSANLNGNIEVTNYSDFGTLTTLGLGANWRGPQGLRLSGAWTREEGAPSMVDLGEPLARFPDRRVFDYQTSSTTNATLITGGNPALQADRREVLSLNLRVAPEKLRGLSFNINPVLSTTQDPVQGFSRPSPDLQAAFPERFLRDAMGNLLAFDTRPINLERTERRELRWGVDYRRSLSDEGGRAGRSSRGRRAMPNLRSRGNRLNLTLFHSIRLRNDITLTPDLPAQDTVGITSGALNDSGAQHDVTFQLRLYRKALSLRLEGQWQSGTQSPPSDRLRLDYADLTQINLSLAYRLSKDSPWVKRIPVLNNTRLRFSLENLLNDKPTVNGRQSLAPPSFSSDELDPRGRSWELQLRKRLS